MIGGVDHLLDGPVAEDDGAFILNAVRACWPEARFQAADSDEVVGVREVALPPPTEFFVYRDAASAASWQLHGAVAELADSMIHVIIGDDEITFVTEGLGSETDDIAGAAITAIRLRRIPSPTLAVGEAA